ncbi:MAG: GDSL-type esterase/lipase family protein [Lachnospiraceae bacterium]|nr:GDSL-type esterase/lipase family protein [Lachnospiraceae bacterium]
MRILMLGNSYIFTNDMPKMLAELTGAEVVHHTRGGARLAEQLNPKTEMGARTQKALSEEHWDYVVLQEMSNAPVKTREKFRKTAVALCDQIHAAGAKPVFYLTWAYQRDSVQMKKSGLDYDEMYRGLQEAYREAALAGDALLADVGTVFYQQSAYRNLYADDGSHPNEEGSRLAAEIIAAAIMEDYNLSMRRQ